MSWYPFPGVRVFALKSVVAAVVIAFLAGAALGFVSAWRIYGWHQAASELKVERASTAERHREETRQRAIGQRRMNKHDLIDQTFVEISDATEIVVSAQPDLRTLDLGADVLCLWRAANEGRSPAAAGCRPAATMQTPDSTDGRESGHAAEEPHPDGAAIPPDMR